MIANANVDADTITLKDRKILKKLSKYPKKQESTEK